MVKNEDSVFPDAIDDRIYMQEVSLSKLDEKQEYDDLRDDGNYSEAMQVLEGSSVDYFGAPILNHIENRFVKLEEYLPTIEKPDWSMYSTKEPNTTLLNLKDNYTWVGPDKFTVDVTVMIVWDDDDNREADQRQHRLEGIARQEGAELGLLVVIVRLFHILRLLKPFSQSGLLRSGSGRGRTRR